MIGEVVHLLVTGALLALAIWQIARALRPLAESRAIDATARLERVRLRKAELEAEEREREYERQERIRREEQAKRKPVRGFVPPLRD